LLVPAWRNFLHATRFTVSSPFGSAHLPSFLKLSSIYYQEIE
jgi:hypothetical protein